MGRESSSGECGVAVGLACLPLILRVHLFVGSSDQVHQAEPLQDNCLLAPLARTCVPMIFFPALTQVREDHSMFLVLPMQARRPTNRANPGTGDCVDVSAAGREDSRSYHQLDEVPGRPTTEIDSFMVGALVTITRSVDLLQLTLSMPCFSLPQPPGQLTALCTSVDDALANLSSSDFTGEPGYGLNEAGLKLVIVHFLLAHPGTPSLFTLLPCPPGPPGHISHLCGVARLSTSQIASPTSSRRCLSPCSPWIPVAAATATPTCALGGTRGPLLWSS